MEKIGLRGIAVLFLPPAAGFIVASVLLLFLLPAQVRLLRRTQVVGVVVFYLTGAYYAVVAGL